MDGHSLKNGWYWSIPKYDWHLWMSLPFRESNARGGKFHHRVDAFPSHVWWPGGYLIFPGSYRCKQGMFPKLKAEKFPYRPSHLVEDGSWQDSSHRRAARSEASKWGYAPELQIISEMVIFRGILYDFCLVLWNIWIMTFPSYWEWNIIIPITTKSMIFQRGRYTTN